MIGWVVRCVIHLVNRVCPPLSEPQTVVRDLRIWRFKEGIGVFLPIDSCPPEDFDFHVVEVLEVDDSGHPSKWQILE